MVFGSARESQEESSTDVVEALVVVCVRGGGESQGEHGVEERPFCTPLLLGEGTSVGVPQAPRNVLWNLLLVGQGEGIRASQGWG